MPGFVGTKLARDHFRAIYRVSPSCIHVDMQFASMKGKIQMIVCSESEEPVSVSGLYVDLTTGRESKGKR